MDRWVSGRKEGVGRGDRWMNGSVDGSWKKGHFWASGEGWPGMSKTWALGEDPAQGVRGPYCLIWPCSRCWDAALMESTFL